MSMHRATRFLIDKVDNRLGDVDKEIKFDKTMISGCLGIVALEIILLALSTLVSFFQIPAIIFAFLCAIAIFIIPVMVKEMKDDPQPCYKGYQGWTLQNHCSYPAFLIISNAFSCLAFMRFSSLILAASFDATAAS